MPVVIPTTCDHCGTSFKPHHNQQRGRYCSRACYAAARSLAPIPCAYCGEMFQPPHIVNIYCSKACSNRGRATTAERRFLRHFRPGDAGECWEWTAGRSGDGYGVFTVGANRQVGAHRFAYQMHHGEVPDELFVLHRCDNPVCVNPGHLWLGTNSDNMRDMVAKGRHRPRGLLPRDKR